MRLIGIPDEELDFIKRLNRSSIRHLIIRGYASKFYNCNDKPNDVDLLIEQSEAAATELHQIVVDLLGYIPNVGVEKLLAPKKKMTLPVLNIETLTSVKDLDFEAAFERRNTTVERGIELTIASRKDLIFVRQEASKDTTRAAREQAEIECLRRGLKQ